jgi:hypothetical protein
VNRAILEALGMHVELDRVDRGLCPICGRDFSVKELTGDLSRAEWRISGMCQLCQDATFNTEESE